MSLRRQLLLVSLLLLSLPWAGCQFIREMEGALRQGQEQSLQATATAIAAVLGQQPQLIYPHSARLDAPPDSGNPIYAKPLEQPLILDGYGDGWEEITGVNMQSEPGAAALALQYKAVTRNGYLYLLLRVEDQQVVPARRPPRGDDSLLALLGRFELHGRNDPGHRISGVRILRQEGDRTLLDVASGRYRFSSPMP